MNKAYLYTFYASWTDGSSNAGKPHSGLWWNGYCFILGIFPYHLTYQYRPYLCLTSNHHLVFEMIKVFCIFTSQILYANEGEAINPEEKEEQQQNEASLHIIVDIDRSIIAIHNLFYVSYLISSLFAFTFRSNHVYLFVYVDQEKGIAIDYLGHKFYVMHYHMPTNCEACTKPLWNMFKPPTALECRSKSISHSLLYAKYQTSFVLTFLINFYCQPSSFNLLFLYSPH